jgi:arylsulfatase
VLGAVGCRSRERPTRVVLVTLDTLRYDTLWGTPDSPSVMPLTRARAVRGLAFDRFFSATSSTQPTHASLFTGLHPWQHGVSRNGLPLADERDTAAEVFRRAGFATAAVVASFPLAARFGFAQGFDVYDDALTEGQLAPAWEGLGDPEERYYRLAERVTTSAMARIDASQAKNQFYWVHYFDPHGPYGDTVPGPRVRPQDLLRQAREGYDVRGDVVRARALYDADARSLDQWLERLFQRLDRDAGRYDTHLIVTADHGESFGEDGSLAHGRRLTAGQIHVPFFIASPRLTASVRHDVAGSVDVPATLYALAGLRATAPGGRDLLLPVKGGRAFGMRRRFGPEQTEVRLDGREHRLDFDLFYAVGADGRIHAGNGAGLRPEEAGGDAGAMTGALQTLFGAFERELAGAESPADNDPEVERALKALGYVG